MAIYRGQNPRVARTTTDPTKAHLYFRAIGKVGAEMRATPILNSLTPFFRPKRCVSILLTIFRNFSERSKQIFCEVNNIYQWKNRFN